MFSARAAKTGNHESIGLTYQPAPKRPTPQVQSPGGPRQGQARNFQRNIGNQALLRHFARQSSNSTGNAPGGEHRQGAAPASETTRDAKPSESRDVTGRTVQRKSEAASHAGGPAPASVQEAIAAPGRPLSPVDRQFFEPRFGVDLSHVRIHDDVRAAESARSIGARAYTLGAHIAFAGPAQTSTEPGRRLLAHELAHTLQPRSAGNVVRRDADAGAPDAGGAQPQSVVDEVMAALREPQENGVGNYIKAYSILNGLWIVDMFQKIEQLRARGDFDLLKSADPGQFQRVTVAIAAVAAKGTPSAAKFPDQNPAFGSIEETQQHEVATYLGLPWPIAQAQPASGQGGGWSTGEVVLVGAGIVIGAALIVVLAPELIPAAATLARGAIIALRVSTAVATALPAATAGGEAIVYAEVTATAVEGGTAAAEAGGAAARGVQVVNMVVRSAQPVAQAAQATAPAAAQLAVTSSAPTVAQAALLITAGGATATLPSDSKTPDKKDQDKKKNCGDRPLFWDPVVSTASSQPGLLDACFLVTDYSMHGHHTWPKFAGGLDTQPLMGVRGSVHISILQPQLDSFLLAGFAKDGLTTSFTQNARFIARLRTDRSLRRQMVASLNAFYRGFNTAYCSPQIPVVIYQSGIGASLMDLGGP